MIYANDAINVGRIEPMRKDSKLLVASLFFLGLSLVSIILDIRYSLGLWRLTFISFPIYAVLFTLFLYYNHKLTKPSESGRLSLRQYEVAIIICGILILTGIIGSVVGSIFDLPNLTYIMIVLVSGSFVALIYSVIGLFDIINSVK